MELRISNHLNTFKIQIPFMKKPLTNHIWMRSKSKAFTKTKKNSWLKIPPPQLPSKKTSRATPSCVTTRRSGFECPVEGSPADLRFLRKNPSSRWSKKPQFLLVSPVCMSGEGAVLEVLGSGPFGVFWARSLVEKPGKKLSL